MEHMYSEDYKEILNKEDKLQESLFGENKTLSRDLQVFLEEKHNIRVLRFFKKEPSIEKKMLLSQEFSLKKLVFIFKEDSTGLHIVMSNPFREGLLEELTFLLKNNIVAYIGKEESILKSIYEFYTIKLDLKKEFKVSDEKEIDLENPVVKLSNEILKRGILEGASDIHIEPLKNVYRIRQRVQGNLYKIMDIEKEKGQSIVSRIKIEASMDIAQRIVPQDGKLTYNFFSKDYDLRVSSMPTTLGEKLVIRILCNDKKIKLDSLGFKKNHINYMRNLIKGKGGLLLITGPTGSGKSTTLYSLIEEMDKDSLNIITIEDPVEYSLEGITQINVNERAGLSFSKILKSTLRQDPDVIMLGEIRDEETAKIAFRAAVTGHLVLATLHTTDAISSLSRLYNMGVPNYILGDTIRAIIAQRLVKKLCNNCKTIMDGKYKKGEGCQLCNFTGYDKRVMNYEFLHISEEIRSAISKGKDNVVIKDIALNEGFQALEDDFVI